jgi:hypothetical protein
MILLKVNSFNSIKKLIIYVGTRKVNKVLNKLTSKNSTHQNIIYFIIIIIFVTKSDFNLHIIFKILYYGAQPAVIFI